MQYIDQSIEQLINNNHHTISMIKMAENKWDKKLIKIFKLIYELESLEWYIPRELINYRNKKYSELWEFAQ